MANEYVQRQISGFIGNSNETNPAMYGIGDRFWSSQDIYPAKIQIIDDGNIMANEIVFAALASGAAVALASGAAASAAGAAAASAAGAAGA